jgi:four helix bundle protein
MKSFRDIHVWQKAYALALKIYKATDSFPSHEIYGLTSQLRRAAVSIPCNIAEGCAKSTDADFARYLDIAIGSASEVECQLLLAHDLDYLNDSNHDELIDLTIEVKRMLASFIKTLRKPNAC